MRVGSVRRSFCSLGSAVNTLANGVRVAALSDRSKPAAASVAVFVNAGTRFETASNAGVTQFLKHSSFKSNNKRSHFRTVRELEHSGAVASVSYGREEFAYSAASVPSDVGDVLERLVDALSPSLHEFEVDECRAAVEAEIKQHDRDLNESLLTAIHRTAYGTTGLGRPLLADLLQFEHITVKDVVEYRQQRFVPGNIIVAGVNVPMATLERASAALATLAGGSSPAKTASVYRGGQTHIATATHGSHAALVFNGVAAGASDLAAQAVLGDLLGTWGHVDVVASPYTDSGLFGITAHAHDGAGLASRVAAVVKLMQEAPRGAAPAALAEAKKRVAVSALTTLESSCARLSELARQLLAGATYTSPAALARAIDAVTAADVAAVAKKVFKTTPTLVTVGDNSHLPSYAELVDKFRGL